MATPTTLPASFVSGSVLQAAQLNDLRGAFRILQVVSTVKDDAFTTSSSTLVDITGFSATITPSSTSSRVFVAVSIPNLSSDTNNLDSLRFQLVRGSTNIFIGATVAGRTSFSAIAGSFGGDMQAISFNFLDSPATTSPTTYKVQCLSANGQLQFNRNRGDTVRGASSITVMEVSA